MCTHPRTLAGGASWVSFDQVEAVPLQVDCLRVLWQPEYFSIAVEYERKVIGSSNELQGRLPFVCLGA